MVATIAVAIGVGLAVWFVSSRLVGQITATVRVSEHRENEETPQPGRRVLAWHLVHVRDDIAALVIVGPNLTNGLLAAILVVLVMG